MGGSGIGESDTMERMAQRQAEAVTSSWAAGPGGSPDGSSTADGDLLINLGEGHPSGHGMLRLRLTLEGDRIVTADPVIGYVHRGAEKLFEARDYRQIIVLANRHDWLGAFASELGVVLAAERLAGIEVPPRGVWARTLLAELNRVLSHLAFLGSYPPGDMALGELRGPMRDETDSFLNRVSLGLPTQAASAAEAHNRLMLTKAMDLSARLKRPVQLPITAKDDVYPSVKAAGK